MSSSRAVRACRRLVVLVIPLGRVLYDINAIEMKGGSTALGRVRLGISEHAQSRGTPLRLYF